MMGPTLSHIVPPPVPPDIFGEKVTQVDPSRILIKTAQYISTWDLFFHIGSELHIDSNRLQILETNHPRDIQGAAREMLLAWWDSSVDETLKWFLLNEVLNHELSQEVIRKIQEDISMLH